MTPATITEALRAAEHIGSGEDAARVVEGLTPKPPTWEEIFGNVRDEE